MKETDIEIKYRDALRHCRPRHNVGDDFSLRHPKMQLSQRAKIFSPFDALKGFGKAIEEKLEKYVEKQELTEMEQRRLNQVISELYQRTQGCRRADRRPVTATVTWYVPCADRNHEAYGRLGSYMTRTGVVRKVDPVLTKTLQIDDAEIDFSDIAMLRIEPVEEEED